MKHKKQLILVVLLVVAIAGFYVYSASNKDQSNNQQEKTAQEQNNAASPKPTSKELKNIGVKIKLDNDANKFTFSEEGGSVVIKSVEFKSLAEDICSKGSGDGAVANISKQDGTFKEGESDVNLVKQFPSFALVDSGPPNGFNCDGNDDANAKASAKLRELNLKAITVFRNAEEIK